MRTLWLLLQVVAIPIISLLQILLRVKIIHVNDIKAKKGCIFISNHQHKIDPFFILNGYGFRKMIVNIPYRFPVTNSYMKKRILRKIIASFGGYSVGETIEEKAKMLFYAREILENKGGVVIFPEGKIVKNIFDYRTFQAGYTFLVSENPQIILTKIENMHTPWLSFFNRKRPKITYYTIDTDVSKEMVLDRIKNFYLPNES